MCVSVQGRHWGGGLCWYVQVFCVGDVRRRCCRYYHCGIATRRGRFRLVVVVVCLEDPCSPPLDETSDQDPASLGAHYCETAHRWPLLTSSEFFSSFQLANNIHSLDSPALVCSESDSDSDRRVRGSSSHAPTSRCRPIHPTPTPSTIIIAAARPILAPPLPSLPSLPSLLLLLACLCPAHHPHLIHVRPPLAQPAAASTCPQHH